MELIASPVIDPGSGQVVQVAAVVWDATGSLRLQQKIDAIDKAGRELVRLESDAIVKMTVVQRLKLLEEKIVSFTRELMHFDHFAIRLLDRKSNKLELCISAGIPSEALNVELFAEAERNGISGYVAATGRSYHLRRRRAGPPVRDGPGLGQEQPDGAAAAARQDHRRVQHREPQPRGVQRGRPAVRRDSSAGTWRSRSTSSTCWSSSGRAPATRWPTTSAARWPGR